VELEAGELASHRPKVVRVDSRNRVVDVRAEVPGPALPAAIA
jgi:aspartate 1-decarboxylase